MWFSENKKKPPVKILSMADTGIILFICINSFTILINLLTILDAIAIKTDIEEYDFFNNKMVLGLLIIILCIMIYFTYHVFIDRNDKYVYISLTKQDNGKPFPAEPLDIIDSCDIQLI